MCSKCPISISCFYYSSLQSWVSNSWLDPRPIPLNTHRFSKEVKAVSSLPTEQRCSSSTGVLPSRLFPVWRTTGIYCHSPRVGGKADGGGERAWRYPDVCLGDKRPRSCLQDPGGFWGGRWRFGFAPSSPQRPRTPLQLWLGGFQPALAS